MHLTVDGHAKDVIGMEVTAVEWADGEVFEGLVEQVEGPIEQIAGDGVYDTRRAYEVAVSREARLVVPPRDNAVPWEDGHPRNDALRQIAEQGMAVWKQTTGYHCRSLAENALYRLKQLFDGSLASRLVETQVTEVHVRIAAMNFMTYLGMPISVRVGGTPSSCLVQPVCLTGRRTGRKVCAVKGECSHESIYAPTSQFRGRWHLDALMHSVAVNSSLYL